jgi:hypothetical protein
LAALTHLATRDEREEFSAEQKRRNLSKVALMSWLEEQTKAAKSAGNRWIGWKAWPLLRIRSSSEDDGKETAEGAGLDLATARPRADYDARARRLQEFKLCG